MATTMTSDQLHACIIMDITNNQVPTRVASKRSFTNGETTVINRYQGDINTSVNNLQNYENEAETLANSVVLATEALQKTTDDFLTRKKDLEGELELENAQLEECERELSVIGSGNNVVQKENTPVKKRLSRYLKTVVLILIGDAIAVALSWAIVRESFAVSDIIKRSLFLGAIGVFAIIEDALYFKEGKKMYFWAFSFSLFMAFCSTVDMLATSLIWAPKLSVQAPSFSLDQVSAVATDSVGIKQVLAMNPGLVEAMLTFLTFLIVHIRSGYAGPKSQNVCGGDSRLGQIREGKESELSAIRGKIDDLQNQMADITAKHRNDLGFIQGKLEQMKGEQLELLSDTGREKEKIATMICDIVQDLSFYRTSYLRTYSRMKGNSTTPAYDLATADDVKEYFNIQQ